MNSRVDILTHLPPFMREYAEIQRLAEAENPEFQAVWEAGAEIKDNLFIMTAAEPGLKRYEDLLGLYQDYGETIETRRQRVFTKWNEQLPFTYKMLERMLDQLCGAGRYTIDLNSGEYRLKIIIAQSAGGSIEAVRSMLERIVPVNIVAEVEIQSNTFQALARFTHQQLAAYSHGQLEHADLDS